MTETIMRSRIWKDGGPEVKPASWLRRAKQPVRLTHPDPAGETGDSAQLRAQFAELNSAREQDRRQAYEAGLRAGEAAARQRADGEVQAVLAKLAESIAAISSLRGETILRAEADTVKLAIEIAHRILHRELSVDPSALEALIKAALEKLQAQEIYRVRVHPDVEKTLRTCIEQTGRIQAIEIICDPIQPKGGAIFEISRGALDASVETQLQEIERGLTDRLEARR